jgi:hypothetical protein
MAGGTIAATRVERIAAQLQVSLIGNVMQLDTSGFWSGSLRVNVADTELLRGLTRNQEVLVTGVLDGDTLHAHSVRAEPAVRFPPTVRRLLIEGLLAESAADKRLRLRGLNMASGAGVELRRDQRVIVDVRIANDGTLFADSVQPVRDVAAPLNPAMFMTPDNSSLIDDSLLRRGLPDFPGDFQRRGMGVPASGGRR